jgi:hypothetical protein
MLKNLPHHMLETSFNTPSRAVQIWPESKPGSVDNLVTADIQSVYS